jgi:hypothetical protein
MVRSFILRVVPTSAQVYVWRMLEKPYNSECLVPTVEHGGGSVMILAAMLWYSDGSVITLNGGITSVLGWTS